MSSDFLFSAVVVALETRPACWRALFNVKGQMDRRLVDFHGGCVAQKVEGRKEGRRRMMAAWTEAKERKESK